MNSVSDLTVVRNAVTHPDELTSTPLSGREDEILARVAGITRSLYEALQTLGIDADIRTSLSLVPDAVNRLKYIEKLTEDAATRTLNAIDDMRPILERLGSSASTLSQRWNSIAVQGANRETIAQLFADTRSFFRSLHQSTATVNTQLSEVLVAQSFQDLTGQVLRKVTEIVLSLERQLADLLMERISPERRTMFAERVMREFSESSRAQQSESPPVPDSIAMPDQEAVDDLLSSLGF
ncbi:protein phosphatase CheZ [Paraburkholderia caffeinilytica]|uniref:Protein phosphatase CheZ n=1 Tax=Paraburkholderia caffeinilytica TaxID=1761016 RepID=A0ABQ1LKZ4_9BURK|nr:protein phosphatase CheZ [Paraburkholderia caffeinilytica]GGC26117.1 protein phosphatase CheZ [Paraburkholderia caffeinilytica]CAB3807879.1 Protein phosphatase CheZ [Paraburkholderia caffeinilytica]